MSVLNRSATALSLTLVLAFAAAPARADLDIDACAASYGKGQEERLAGRLLSAAREFAICADPSCPRVVVRDCRRWATEVDAATPSVSLSAKDAAGKQIDALVVFVDNVQVAPERLAVPLQLDAGSHRMRFEASGYEPVQFERVLSPGEQQVPVAAVLRRVPMPAPACAPSAPAPPKRVEARFPVAAVSLTGVGVVALAGAAFFGLNARSRYEDLKSSCAPSCPTEQTNAVHRTALVSDALLAASIVGFGAAAWFYFGGAPDVPEQKSRATALGVESRAGGAQLKLRLRF